MELRSGADGQCSGVLVKSAVWWWEVLVPGLGPVQLALSLPSAPLASSLGLHVGSLTVIWLLTHQAGGESVGKCHLD